MENLTLLPETDRSAPPRGNKKGADLGDFASYFAKQVSKFYNK
jgi:hypothetical protein